MRGDGATSSYSGRPRWLRPPLSPCGLTMPPTSLRRLPSLPQPPNPTLLAQASPPLPLDVLVAAGGHATAFSGC